MLFRSREASSEIKNDTVDQIKNITQEKKIKPELQKDPKFNKDRPINSFDNLLEVCNDKKEIKLKYELEKNVNLVSFEKNRIEISFNDNLDKSFIKELSSKLYEWTGDRWIITLSKSKGEMSVKQKEINKKVQLIEDAKNSELYQKLLNKFPDANLIDVSLDKKKEI